MWRYVRGYGTDGNGSIDGHKLAIVVIVAGYETAYGGTSYTIHPAVWGHHWGWGNRGWGNPPYFYLASIRHLLRWMGSASEVMPSSVSVTVGNSAVL